MTRRQMIALAILALIFFLSQVFGYSVGLALAYLAQ